MNALYELCTEYFVVDLMDEHQKTPSGTGCSKVLLECHQLHGCNLGKIVFFFKIHCNPSLAFISVRDLLISQRNASVQSLLLAG